jgi:DNA-binding beta-propeller fold protein YncE
VLLSVEIPPGAEPMNLVGPVDVAVDDVNSVLYMADGGQHRILSFDARSGDMLDFDGGFSMGQSPHDLAWDGHNARLYISDSQGQLHQLSGVTGARPISSAGSPFGVALGRGQLYRIYNYAEYTSIEVFSVGLDLNEDGLRDVCQE